METPEHQSRLLPEKPGVYLFRDARGKVLYVGKAANLLHRVRSYFVPQHTDAKTRWLVPEIADIDFIVTASEQEALILENTLIKRHRPRFNVRLKDDKTYPYLKITLADEWPAVHISRRIQEDGSRYFGPYAGAHSLRETMNLLNKLFPYRTCRQPIAGKLVRPCLKYHIKRCAGPCAGAISREEYRRIIEGVILFLSGKHGQIVRDLKRRMNRAADALEFERAAALRDQIAAIEQIAAEQKVVSSPGTVMDVIAIAQERNIACAQVLFIRGGKLLGKEHFILEGALDERLEAILTGFLQQYYGAGAEIPPEVVVPTDPLDRPLLDEWLSGKRGRAVRLVVPGRGRKRQLLDMAAENASEMLRQWQARGLADSGKTGAALEEVRTHLRLPRLPRRIECYDISNIRGTSAVGSMVVFEDGRPKPALYRRFKIKSVTGIDDYAMMREVLGRRFRRGGGEGAGGSWEGAPDLVLIDGGRGHLHAALDVMEGLQIGGIPVAAIAKENEEIFLPNVPHPLRLARSSPGLYLLQRIRDEAHRFAVSYHVRIRGKKALASVLDEVAGIGPKRKRALLKAFGSLRRIRAASVEELASVEGISPALARRIKQGLGPV